MSKNDDHGAMTRIAGVEGGGTKFLAAVAEPRPDGPPHIVDRLRVDTADDPDDRTREVLLELASPKIRIIDTVWDPVFGEQSRRVLDSQVSERMRGWFAIPDAALGAIAYLGDAIFGLAGSRRRWQYRPWMVVLFGIDVIPLGIVSVVLVVLQGMAVGAWCFLCIVTAVISLVLVVMAYDEVWSSLLYLWRVWRSTRSPAVLWRCFWGRGSAPAARVALASGS